MLTDQALHEVGDEVWTSLLGVGLSPADAEAWGEGATFRTGCISIGGEERQYALFVDASERLLRRLAAEIFESFADLIKEEELEDALGEICNISGGMAQNRLSGPYRLGLPVISKGRSHGLAIPPGMIIADVKASCGGEPIRLTFLGLDKRR